MRISNQRKTNKAGIVKLKLKFSASVRIVILSQNSIKASEKVYFEAPF